VLRSLLVLAFIGGVAAAAGYLAQRPTIASGAVIAADLLARNAGSLRAVECDPEIPIGVDGARFWCRAELVAGGSARMELQLDRAGAIHQVDPSAAPEHAIDKSDPWR